MSGRILLLNPLKPGTLKSLPIDFVAARAWYLR
jgi:hypothetical protein